MKKCIVIHVLLLLFVVFIAGCGDDDTNLPEYYIAFTVDGQAKVFGSSFGETEYNNNPFSSYDVLDTSTILFAQPVQTYLSNGEPSNYLFIQFLGNASGSFNISQAEMHYIVNNEPFQALSLALVVAEYGIVGGVVEGTFSAAITNEGGPLRQITDGSFRLLRLADDTFDP